MSKEELVKRIEEIKDNIFLINVSSDRLSDEDWKQLDNLRKELDNCYKQLEKLQ